MEKNVICGMKIKVTKVENVVNAEGRSDFAGSALDKIVTLAHVFELLRFTEEEAVQYTLCALQMRYGEGGRYFSVKTPTMGNKK